MSEYGERIARVEVEVQELRKAFEAHREEVNSKLDSLLALRNKGAGIVWLISGLIGTGIVGTIIELIHWK